MCVRFPRLGQIRLSLLKLWGKKFSNLRREQIFKHKKAKSFDLSFKPSLLSCQHLYIAILKGASCAFKVKVDSSVLT